jgi:hypothetical protein
MSMTHRSGPAQGKRYVRSPAMHVHDLYPAPPGRSSVAMPGQTMPKSLSAGMPPAEAARVPSGTSRRAHKGRGLGHQSRIRRDIRPQPAPCLPTHRYSCPMTAGHLQPDHDGGRRYGQHRRLELLKDHNCGMVPVAHHAAFRWRPDRARRCTPCPRSSARWQESPLPATAWPGETSSTPVQPIDHRSLAIKWIPNV